MSDWFDWAVAHGAPAEYESGYPYDEFGGPRPRMSKELHLTIPDHMWEDQEPAEKAGQRLIVTLRVNGVPMHLEAWEVTGGDAELQETVAYPDDLDKLMDAVSANSPFVTWEINGREYILVASPHCD